MTSPGQFCEVKVGSAWHAVSLKEARLQHGDALKRCPNCHGRVTIAGIYSAQGLLTLSHRRSHDGCSLNPRHYQGVPSRHPEVLV